MRGLIGGDYHARRYRLSTGAKADRLPVPDPDYVVALILSRCSESVMIYAFWVWSYVMKCRVDVGSYGASQNQKPT